MDNQQIVKELLKNENQLRLIFKEQDQKFWEAQPDGKWTAGQHVIHLIQSTKPLLKAIRLPDFILKWKFGTSNRPSRSYEDVCHRYEEKLAKVGLGVVGPFSKNMPFSPYHEAEKWLDTLSHLNEKLNKATTKLSDKQMDTILIAHPLMGKMTLREILMWNAYHTLHHLQVLKQKYL